MQCLKVFLLSVLCSPIQKELLLRDVLSYPDNCVTLCYVKHFN